MPENLLVSEVSKSPLTLVRARVSVPSPPTMEPPLYVVISMMSSPAPAEMLPASMVVTRILSLPPAAMPVYSP